MKKIVSTLALMLVITALPAMACIGPNCGSQTTTGFATAANQQAQLQGDFGFVTPNSVVVGAGGVQEQSGGGTALGRFSSASDSQAQAQGTTDNFGNALNDAGYISAQQQEGGGVIKGTGLYGYEGVQGQGGIMGAIGNGNGTASFGGSGYIGGGQNSALVLGNGAAHQSQSQVFGSGYENINPGPNGIIIIGGYQEAGTHNNVGVNGTGNGSSEVFVAQAGGSAAVNDGKGTAMAGGSGSVGFGTATVSNECNSEAGFGAIQTHEYEQVNVSNDGKSWQVASGQTSTTIFGSVGNNNN